MITTPEIDRLTKRRDAHREEARKIEDKLQDLRRKERERVRVAKAGAKHDETRVKWQDRRSVANETHRLRVLLADAMRAIGAKSTDIEKAIGIRMSGLRIHRCCLERGGILTTNKPTSPKPAKETP